MFDSLYGPELSPTQGRETYRSKKSQPFKAFQRSEILKKKPETHSFNTNNSVQITATDQIQAQPESSRFTRTTYSIQISSAGVYIPLDSATQTDVHVTRNVALNVKTYSCSSVLLWIYLLDFMAIFIYFLCNELHGEHQKISTNKWCTRIRDFGLFRTRLNVYWYTRPLKTCGIWLGPWSSGGPTKGMGAMADAPSAVPPLVLPHCKMWWSPSPGTTCWRWDWAELLLFVPLAPGFHKSLFLTLKEWCKLQMQCGQAEASIGIYGMVIYTRERGEGSKELPVQYLSPHPSSTLLPLFWGFAGLLKVLCSVKNSFSSCLN